MSRHNIWIPAELWEQIVRAAGRDWVEQNTQTTVSEWIREAIRQRLAKGEK